MQCYIDDVPFVNKLRIEKRKVKGEKEIWLKMG